MPGQSVRVVTPGQAKHYWLVADYVTIRLTGDDTGGQYSLMEFVVPPNGGTPPHVHRREDECFTILEGELEFWTENGTQRAAAGDVVHAPRNIPHAYKNVGASPARMLMIASPPGFERFVAAAGSPVVDHLLPPPVDVELLTAIAAEHGIEILPPSTGGRS